MRSINNVLTLLDSARPVARVDALIPAGDVGAERKVERLIYRELCDETDAGSELVSNLAERVDAAEPELIGE